MTETIVDDRSALLEAFAQSADAPPAVMPAVALPAVEQRFIGAQKVAVQRDEAKILKKIRVLASAAGEDWYYRFQVKNKDGSRDWIEGPSIKLANDLARLYGNCDVDCRIYDTGDSLVFYARFTDLETGFTMTRPFQQRRSQKTMNTDSGRAADIVFQIGASKAIRNVVVNALQTFADFAFAEAKAGLIGRIGKDVEKWRARILVVLGDLKIDVKRVEITTGRAAKDWLAPDIARISAEIQAVRDGMATAEETWPPLDEVASKDNRKTEDAPPPPKGGRGKKAGPDKPAETPPDEKTAEPAGDRSKAPETTAKTDADPPTSETPAGETTTEAAKPAVQDAAPDAAKPSEATAPAPAQAEDPAAKWKAFREGFEKRIAGCKSVEDLGELVETEHDNLVDFEKFDREGRMALRDAVSARGRAIHEGKA